MQETTADQEAKDAVSPTYCTYIITVLAVVKAGCLDGPLDFHGEVLKLWFDAAQQGDSVQSSVRLQGLLIILVSALPGPVAWET